MQVFTADRTAAPAQSQSTLAIRTKVNVLEVFQWIGARIPSLLPAIMRRAVRGFGGCVCTLAPPLLLLLLVLLVVVVAAALLSLPPAR